MYNPLVSIIIPVYNGSNYLYSSLSSAVHQTYHNIEIIVIDDGSDIFHDYESIINKFETVNITLKRIEENSGVSSAMNLGIKIAKGKFINWLSHDDFMHPQKIELQIKKYEQIDKFDKEDKIIYSNYIQFNNINDYSRKIQTIKIRKSVLLWLLISDRLHGCALLIPKNLFIKHNLSFDTNLRHTQDYDIWIKLAFKNVNFYLVKDFLIYSRVHSQQSSKDRDFNYYNEKNNFYLSKIKLFVESKPSFNSFEFLIILYSFMSRGYYYISGKIISLYFRRNKLFFYNPITLIAFMIIILLGYNRNLIRFLSNKIYSKIIR